MNEFENDVQSKNNDVSDSIIGVAASFVFFIVIFAIGALINVVA